jgi:ribonuclease P protein component
MARHAQQADAGRRSPARQEWRSLKSADFAALMGAPIRAKTTHFVLHHLAGDPVAGPGAGRRLAIEQISTADAPILNHSVDNTDAIAHWWLGIVVPKRHARRAVARSLLRRQMRVHAEKCRTRMPPGRWLIRLRAPFDARQYPSAASVQLRVAAQRELATVFVGVAT